MIPLRDDTPRRCFPFMTLLIIGLNVAFFVYELTLSQPQLRDFVYQWAIVPRRIPAALNAPSVAAFQAAFAPFFSCMFLHGSWLHLLGNVWALWLFGDNIEDHLGHFRFVFFYVVTGLAGQSVHVLFNLHSATPMLGASAAVAGVMGGYFLLFPFAWMTVLFIFVIFPIFLRLPAFIFLLIWFLTQISGGTAVATAEKTGPGIAFLAHVGGFVSGLILVKVLLKRPRYAPRGRGRAVVSRSRRGF